MFWGDYRKILYYDEASGLLHFSCPPESEMADKKLIVANFGRYNQRTADGQVSRIASWFNNTATRYENRTVLNSTRRVGLTGFLTDVRCEDSQTYYCSYHYADPKGHIESHVENATFTFEGSQFVSITKAPQTHHCPGDTIELKCRAHLGRQNNVIFWESKAAGEQQFSADISSKASHSGAMDTKNCNYYSESTLSRVLRAADNERVWRCRLTYGDAEDDVIIAVDQNKERCLKDKGENSADVKLTSVQSGSECCTGTKGSPAPAGRSTEENTLNAATCVLIIVALLVVVVVFIGRNLLRARCKSVKLLNDDSAVFLVSSTTHRHHDEELAAGPELFIPPPLGDVDADNEYAGFSDDHLDLDPMTSSPHNSHDAISSPGSAVPPPPFDPEYSQLDGDSEDYHRLGRHGNSHKLVDSASPDELNYQHLSHSGEVPETPVSDWMITATESCNNPDKIE